MKSEKKHYHIPADDYKQVRYEVGKIPLSNLNIACNIPRTYGTNLSVFSIDGSLAFIHYMDDSRSQWLTTRHALLRIVTNPKTRAGITPAARQLLQETVPTFLKYLTKHDV